MDSAQEKEFDRVVQVARDATRADTALLSLLDGQRQFFKAKSTEHPKLSKCSETPLSKSFCKHVVGSQEPLCIEDSREHPLVQNNPAVKELDVIAYLGQPITLSNGKTMGALCVIEETPREWTDHDTRVIETLAEITSDRLEERRKSMERSQRALLEANFISDNRIKFDSVEMVGRFAAGIAHDFKSVLAVIQSTSQVILSEMGQDNAWREDLEFILEAVSRGHGISEGILQAVQTEPENLEEFELTEEIQQLAPRLDKAAGPAVDVRLDIADTDLPMRASREMVELIIENLVTNSVEALGADAGGRVVVRVDESEETRRRKYARISVTDSGRGMDPEALVGAFSPYFSNPNHSTTTSTGLSQVLKIVERLGGTIEAHSTPDGGTTIEVILPCRVEILAPSGS